MTSFILQAEKLSKVFETAQGDLNAVDNLSFNVAKREFLCLVGPSGCGKTTILQMLAGLLSPTQGRILLDDKQLTGPSFEISIVFQKPNLMPWRTVLDNVLLPLQIARISRDQAQAAGTQILTQVGLNDFAHAYPKEISGGMEQRVALARALIQNPNILLLDEPFGALDALTRERLNLELLRLWQNQELTAVMVTHNIREAVFLADRVLVVSPRPATIAAEFRINLPRPRPAGIEYHESFGTLAYKIRQAIRD